MALATLALASCREEINISSDANPPGQSGTLLNSSFEQGGGSTLLGWTASNPQLTTFTTDVPPDGGMWAVSLASTPGPATYIQALFPAGTGTSIYKLSVWGKYLRTPGTVSVIQKIQDNIAVRVSIPVQDTVWNSYVLFDTLSTGPGDSIGVRLSGGITEITTGIVVFDLCLFERL